MTPSVVEVVNLTATSVEVSTQQTVVVHDEVESVLVIPEITTVEVQLQPDTQSIEVGLVGPQGPQGLQGPTGTPEDEVMYSKRVDFITDNELYRGEAVPGSPTANPVWRIRKITIGLDNDVSELWADGSDAFSQIWDDRLSLTYS